MEYQLPRLTKMWTHLERQAGGKVKGMGEKQIEVDKRILRTQVSNIEFLKLHLYVDCSPCQNADIIYSGDSMNRLGFSRKSLNLSENTESNIAIVELLYLCL